MDWTCGLNRMGLPGMTPKFLDCLEQGLANFFSRIQIINILGFMDRMVFGSFPAKAAIDNMEPMGMALFQCNLIEPQEEGRLQLLDHSLPAPGLESVKVIEIRYPGGGWARQMTASDISYL